MGGMGDDIYIVGNQGVTVTEAAGGGQDEIRTSLASYSMASQANIENLTFIGTSNAVLTGNAGDNNITGGTGNDTLNGGDGNDQLNGGSGDDKLIGGAGADHFIGGAGTDIADYTDSTLAMTFNLSTGSFSGIGAGDSFDGIEIISGTNFGDTFIASAAAERENGGAGIDMISYSAATSAVGINLTTGLHTGFAEGDEFPNVEVVQGSAFADTFVGNGANNIFIGGAGADEFDGAGGLDSLWYLSSNSEITIDLSAGTASGGDAAGDTFINIDAAIGSNYNDTLTAASTGSTLEGAGGSDIINGGAGADILYGGLNTDTGAAGTMTTGSQADTIRGGAGDDRIYSAGNSNAHINYGDDKDVGSIVYGDGGADSIVVSSGTAYGGTENDTITVWGSGVAYGDAGDDTLNGEYIDFSLYGGDGADHLNMKLGKGFADGGNGGDIYHTDTILQSNIHDTGTGGNDYVYLDRVANLADLVAERNGNDLLLVSQEDKDGGITYQDSLVILEDWYGAGNTIEFFVLSDGTTISGGAIA